MAEAAEAEDPFNDILTEEFPEEDGQPTEGNTEQSEEKEDKESSESVSDNCATSSPDDQIDIDKPNTSPKKIQHQFNTEKYLINIHAVRRMMRQYQLKVRLTDAYLLELNDQVAKMLLLSARRCLNNNRKTMYEYDL